VESNFFHDRLIIFLFAFSLSLVDLPNASADDPIGSLTNGKGAIFYFIFLGGGA
jgi:hypothetical protein